jgi:arabinan endo-1,5-alpha-L-arabinosidase
VRPRTGACAVAVIALLLTGCGADSPTPQAPSAPGGAIAPVIDRDFPDPDVLALDDRYLAFATNGNNRNVQVAESTDLESWQVLNDDALPELPSWVIPGKTWAPEVTELADGSFVMYFTATNFQPSVQCIGVATSAEPEGPFVVQGDAMLVCPAEEGGAIDASTFEEDGTLYLLWKNDGNCCGLDTWISMAALSADGLTLAGEPRRIIQQTLPWEGDLVEAPTLVERDGTYYLLYSSNSYGDDRYAIGLATATSLDGPWEKSEEPFFSTDSSGGAYRGPGGQDLVVDEDGDAHLVFHAWDAAYTYRGVFVEPVEWTEQGPEVVVAE